MEVSALDRIAELGGDLGSLPNLNFLSRIFTSFFQSQRFWRWAVPAIALLASFSGVINRLKILTIVIRRRKPASIVEPPSRSLHGGERGGFVSENLGSPLLLTSESEGEKQGDWEPESEDGFDVRVKGSGRVSGEFDDRRCSGLPRQHGGGDSFSWSWKFGSGSSVVRQWGDVKLRCEFAEWSGSVISLYDENVEAEICSIVSGGDRLQAAALLPGRRVVASGLGGVGNVSLKVWDTRARSRTPVVAAEWNSPSGKIVDVYSEDLEMVYIRDDGAAGIMVGDVRKVCSASESRTGRR